MPLNTLDCAIGGAGVVALALLYRRQSSHAQALPFPPGPPRWPLVGCIFSIPQNEPTWTSFVRWGKETGSDVIYVRVLGSDTVVLNSREAAVELLDRRSSIYSDRPRMVMASELIGWENMLGMSEYGERARAIRKLLHSSMNPKVMKDWWPVQERETLRFLQMLSQKPENLINHIRRTAGATVAKLTYGYNAQDEADEYIAKAERVMDTFSITTTPGAFLVDIFPSLKYFPWASFQRKAREWRAHLVDLVISPIEFVREHLNAGEAEPSFVSKWLEETGHKNDETLVAWAAASLYAGGADTTVSAISTFFVAMLHYPEVQRLAQAELDRVIGKDKLPTLADRGSLPYLEALYKEVLRWQPLAPIGIPHRLASDTDDEYNGMRIPANSMVIANIWSILRDPTVYKAPETFDPSRFIGPEEESNPEDVAFGFGRRRCPGITVAQSSVWLSIALTLAAYDVSPATGADGKPMLPSLQYTSGTVSHPLPFRCDIKPRTEQVKRLIEDALLETV